MKFFSLLFLILCIALMTLNAQIDKDKAFWERYAIERTEQWASDKAEAKLLNEGSGFPLRTELPNGQIFELMKFTNGFPIYYKTMNQNAAQSSMTDLLWPGDGYLYDLSGSNVLLGIWDGGAVRTGHIEFRIDRATQMDGVSVFSSHSTHVAGTMIAEGVDAEAKGMSFEAYLNCYEWNNDEAEMATAYSNGLRASNHSYGYGTGWEWNIMNDDQWGWYGDTDISETEDYNFGFYSFASESLDELAYDAPYYVIVRAAGNDRNDVPVAQPTTHWVWGGSQWVESTTVRDQDGGTDGYDCISHHSLAKNIITVGAVVDIPNGYSQASDVVATSFSSWGPCDDGRIKPDIVANGATLYSCTPITNTSYGTKSGTSMAAPTVTGSIGLLFQWYNDLGYQDDYLSSTWKAILLHTADESGSNIGPDYAFGWGLMNTLEAANLMTENFNEGNDFYIREGTLSNGDSYDFEAYSDGETPIKITICWIDPEGTPIAPELNPRDIMLVNDLDLTIEDPNTTIHYPWVLDPVNPDDAAYRDDNDVDNVEQVFISSPAPGIYTISITHEGTLQGDNNQQRFSVCISGLTPVIKPKLALPPVMKDKMGIPYDFEWYNLPNADTYDIQISTGEDFNPGDLVVNETGISENTYQGTIDNLEIEMTYWWRVRGVIASTPTAWSCKREFRTARSVELCEAGSNECDEFIARVQIESIDNSSSCSDNDNAYSDYMDISTDLRREYTYTMTITNGFAYVNDQCGVWVDWNQNNDFTDAGEQMTVTGGPAVFYATIEVPADANLGELPVRIRILYNETPIPCGFSMYGEVEDYMFNILETTDYCQAGSDNCSEYISNVEINDINNSSTCPSSNDGYDDFSYISTDFEAGIQNMTVTVSNYNINDAVGVWVDWNHDGDFNDFREEMDVVNTNNVFTVTLRTPTIVLLGDARMRIRLQRGSTPEPCGTTQYGEVEDYTLTVIVPIEELDPPVLTTPTNGSGDISMNPIITWETVENADEYTINLSPDSDFSNVLLNYTSQYTSIRFINFLQNTETDYFWHVKAINNQTQSEWSDTWVFTTEKYCSASAFGSIYIRNVSVNNIDNDSQNEYYGDFRHISTDISIGIAYPISIQTVSISDYCQVWVDWNQDGDFDDSNEDYLTTRSGANFIGTITAPWDALPGEARMRVRLDEDLILYPCGRMDVGEVEDYTLNVDYVQVEAPTLLEPANNNDNMPIDVDFSWIQVQGAQWYEIEIAKDQDFNDIIVSDDINIPTYSVEDMKYIQDYWWRVKAVNTGYESPWSNTFKFTTYTAPIPESWDFATNTGNSASIIVPMNIDPVIGERSFITGDAVGVFFLDNDERICAGYGVWWGGDLTITVWRDNPITPEKDGFSINEDFNIRIWDGLKGHDFPAVATYRDGDPDHYTLNGESYLTSLGTELISEHTINLSGGWNLISSYIEPADSDVEDMLSEIVDYMLILKNGASQLYFPSLGLNTIEDWDFYQGYKLYMNNSADITIEGELVAPDESPLNLASGWNLIAYLRTSVFDIEDIMDDILGNLLIVKNGSGDIYFPSLTINTIGNMNPGEGYKVYMTSSDILTYPANSTPKKSQHKQILTPKARKYLPAYTHTGSNATYIIDLGDKYNTKEICIFDSYGLLIGSGIAHNGMAAICVWGDNELTDQKDGAYDNEILYTRTFDEDSDQWKEIILGSTKSLTTGSDIARAIYSDDEIFLAKLSATHIDILDYNVDIIPNPATKETELSITLPVSCVVKYEIYDSKGAILAYKDLGNLPAGRTNYQLALEGFSSGSYQLLVKMEGKVISKKLFIVK